MDTKHLEYFRIVYEEKSIHAAAKKLFISPQGLGRIIQNLESEFGTTFFNRTKNGVFPTKSGTLFYEQCVKICQDLKLLQSRMERMEEEDRSLRIGFATGTLQLFPLDILYQFIDNHREMEWSRKAHTQITLSGDLPPLLCPPQTLNKRRQIILIGGVAPEAIVIRFDPAKN